MSPVWRQQQLGRMSRAEGRHGSVVIAALQIFLNQTSVVVPEPTRRQLRLSCIIVVTPWTPEVRFDSLHRHSQTGIGPTQCPVQYVHPWVQSRERDTEPRPRFFEVWLCVLSSPSEHRGNAMLRGLQPVWLFAQYLWNSIRSGGMCINTLKFI